MEIRFRDFHFNIYARNYRVRWVRTRRGLFSFYPPRLIIYRRFIFVKPAFLSCDPLRFSMQRGISFLILQGLTRTMKVFLLATPSFILTSLSSGVEILNTWMAWWWIEQAADFYALFYVEFKGVRIRRMRIILLSGYLISKINTYCFIMLKMIKMLLGFLLTFIFATLTSSSTSH